MNANEILKAINALPLEEITMIRSDLDEVIQKKALAVLSAKEEELNQVRVLAGLKKKRVTRK